MMVVEHLEKLISQSRDLDKEDTSIRPPLADTNPASFPSGSMKSP
jgi:hypothetical protein